MHIHADTFDDLMRKVINKVLKKGQRTRPTRGPAIELFGVLLEIRNPCARLSRTENRGTLFSALGELLWYLARDNTVPFIDYYIRNYSKENSSDGKTINGAYGPRLFGMRGLNQINNLVRLLRRKRNSRRGVIQILNAEDVARRHKEIPCTCTLQFAIRANRLHLFANMRSNDVYLGLPHDVFAFTMLQEILARQLRVGLGTYTHAVGSLHIYEKDIKSVKAYLREGWQETSAAMPRMPAGDLWPSIKQVLKLEKRLRLGKSIDVKDLPSVRYWRDIVKLLQIQKAYSDKRIDDIDAVGKSISTRMYDPYIEKRKTMLLAQLNPA